MNIQQENHKQVVQRIKAIPNETRLLVVDKSTDDYYKKLGIVIRSSMPNVLEKSSVMSSLTTNSLTTSEVITNGNLDNEAIIVANNVSHNEAHNEAINVSLNDNNHQVIHEQSSVETVEVESASPRSSKSSTASMEKVRQV